jgi:hypothetical protein
MEQKLIKVSEIELGDEIIISSYSSLKYLKIVQLPKKKESTRFKCSIKRIQRTSGNWSWGVNAFEQDVTQHNHVFYQDFYDRDIFLVKRENNI